MLRFILMVTISLACLHGLTGGEKNPSFIPRPTEHAEFSLLTNSPGSELYTIFGHSALRYKDTLTQTDLVFNYGTFNFDTPYFYLKFIRGKLNYFLSLQSFASFYFWTDDVQTVYEQKLNLSREQEYELLRFLENNYREKNRFYMYDFFFDNCATRIRDALKSSFEHQITFEFFAPDDNQSFRELLDPYIEKYPWVDLGIDLALGMPADRIAEPLEYMFLPDYLMEGFAVASINGDSGMNPLVRKSITLKEGIPANDNKLLYASPRFVFWLLLIVILGITLLEYKKNKTSLWIDRLFFGITGLLGGLLLFLWFGTNHQVMGYNLNLWWALPTHLIILPFLNQKGTYTRLSQSYFLAVTLVSISFLIFSKWAPQDFHAAVYPLVLIQLIRSVKNYRQLRRSIQ